MQSLEVISVNLWQIIISLANLVILFLIIKKFLFKPVKKVLAQRQETLDNLYLEAQQAASDAQENKKAWENKMLGAQSEADAVIKNASVYADLRSGRIIADARDKADGIIRQAETEAELERRRAEQGLRREIADISAALTEKILGREINAQDHRAMIDSFIEEMGDSNE